MPCQRLVVEREQERYCGSDGAHDDGVDGGDGEAHVRRMLKWVIENEKAVCL